MSGDRYFIRDQNAMYFVTFTVIEWLDIFSRSNHKFVIVDSLNYCVENKGLNVHAWCLMTNHIHTDFLVKFIAARKKDKRITKYKFWQASNHAIELQPFRPDIMDQKLNYIHYNPVVAGIVLNPEEYLCSSARDYAKISGLVKIQML
jgi:putative transposase